MNITQITVATHYTYNLGNYSNIRPEVQMTATLETQDTLDETVSELRRMTLAACQHQIDETLEANGDPAFFSRDPRFTAYYFRDEELVYIQSSKDPAPDVPNTRSLDGYRLPHLKDLIQERFPNAAVVYELPDLKYVFWKEVGKILFVGLRDDRDDFPEYFDIRYQTKTAIRIWDQFVAEQEQYARTHDLLFINLEIFDLESLETIPAIQRLKTAQEPPSEDDFEDPFDEEDEEE
jgi:hypothetical protein